jgi:hypothetical protein
VDGGPGTEEELREAIEKAGADGPLESRDAHADRSLGHLQRLGGLGKTGVEGEKIQFIVRSGDSWSSYSL